jgi:hypothetical protein
MGGFADNPELPEALDVGPENAFDVQSFTATVANELRKQGVIENADAASDKALKLVLDILGTLWNLTPDALKIMGNEWRIIVETGLKLVVSLAGTILQPGMEVLGEVTSQYVQQFVEQQKGVASGGLGKPPTGLKSPAAGLFDSILAPLGFLVGGENPANVGAGEANAQYVLGSIIGIHLSTWMVNIISNLSGLGVLKFINSFDDVVTSALSTRGLSRMALKAYTAKFIGDPLKRDLDYRLPLDIGSVAALVKRYIRGNMTAQELKFALRGRGYNDEVVADLLLDSAKLFSVDDLLWMIDQGIYTFEQAVESLKQQGYLDEVARVKLRKPESDLVDSQMRSLASSLVLAFIDHRIDNPTLRYLLQQAGFSQEEVNAMVVRGAILQELPTRLSRSDVVNLFNEGLVDLTYVLNWLTEEGYSDDDADLLALLYFTKKEERDAMKARLAENRRLADERRRQQEAATLAQQQAELLALG